VRCGGASGAQNWRGGAADAADGCGQRSSDEVVERRRKIIGMRVSARD
jgi:hypothetical protein